MKSTSGNFIQNLLNKVKSSLHKIYHARGSVHEIALGAAIGAFWGVFPTFGLSTILTLFLYKFFRFNLLVAISAAFISNPLTSPFWLVSSYSVGNYFIKSNIKFDIKEWKNNLPHIGYALLLGATLVSSLTALIVYYVTKYFIRYRRTLKSRNSI